MVFNVSLTSPVGMISGSIYAAKVTDRMMMPERGDSAGGALQFVSDRPMHLVAHADLKDSDVGTSSTFLAATHYTEEAKKRRDELLAKYKDHETTA